jgi:hypothetical protein
LEADRVTALLPKAVAVAYRNVFRTDAALGRLRHSEDFHKPLMELDAKAEKTGK